MPRRKIFRKRRRKRKTRRGYKTLINRGVNPISNSYVTTVEFNDILSMTGSSLASQYGIFHSNDPNNPHGATNFTGAVADKPYGWSNLIALYARYAVLSSSIHLEVVNQSGTNIPLLLSLHKTRDASWLSDLENQMGDPTGKNVLVSNYNKGKLSMYSRPYKDLGISLNDDTYRSLTTSSPALQHYWHVGATSANGTTYLDASIRVTIRYKVRFSDRKVLVQTT